MSSDRTSPTFTPCPECRIVGAHRFDCSLNPRIRAATPEQLQTASRPPGVPPDAESRATCLFCGGRGTLHARGGAATGTCPLPPSGCGGSGTVDAATRAAQEAQRNAPSALAAFHSSPSSPLVEAARILDAGLARPPGTVAPTPPIASPALTVGAVRPCVAAFALAMEAKLRENDHKPGWKGDDPGRLVERLREETDELLAAVVDIDEPRSPRPDSERRVIVGREAADVANFAMMVADVCGALDAPDSRGPLASPLLVALAVDDSKLAVPSQLREVDPHELPERSRALAPEPDHEADVGSDGAGVEVVGGGEVRSDGFMGGHAKSIAATPPTRKRESTAMRGAVDLVVCVECQRVVPETDTEETEDGTVCRWCDEEARTPLASPRPAEAEREGRLDRVVNGEMVFDQGGRCYECRTPQGERPGCVVCRPPTPDRAIAAPGPDLPARVAALLAVADRATPGPWFTHDDEDTHGVESSRGTIAVCDVSPFKDEEMIRIDNMMAIATLRDAPGIIREQQAEIERLRRLAISAGRQLDEAFSLIDPDDPVALAPVSATRLAIEKLAKETP